MKTEEVPQDALPYYGEQRKAVYAQDREGHYAAVPSSGWLAEATVTGDAIAEYERLAQAARVRVEQGDSSPLEYHMYARRMDVPTLAQSTAYWRFSVRRALRPQVFARLGQRRLQGYADALGIAVDELKKLP
ncbi:MAG: hypothetical protein ACREVL_12760 [Solimonas sp.]